MTHFIDKDDRYSRQSYTIGRDMMTKLSESSVLIIGYNTHSQEISKNLALLGINNIDIFVKNKLENYQKTGLYYGEDSFITELQKLNPSVNINNVNILDEEDEVKFSFIKKYNIMVLVNSMIDDCLYFNRISQKLKIPLIITGAYGLVGYVFNDFGEKFIVNDVDGEQYENLIIESIDGKNIKFKDEHKLSDSDILIYSDNLEMKVKKTITPYIIEMVDSLNEDISFYKNVIKKKFQ